MKAQILFKIWAFYFTFLGLFSFSPQVTCFFGGDKEAAEEPAKDGDHFGKAQQMGKKGGSGLLESMSGTFASGANAMGQSMSNYGGDTPMGQLGKDITKKAKEATNAVKFLLFTQSNKKKPIFVTAKTLKKAETFNPKDPLIIIIHGFSPGGYYEKPEDNLISLLRVKNGILDGGIKANAIVMDWTKLSSDMNYVFASTATASVAEDISDFIVYAVKKKLAEYSKIRIVGHSLGGQTAGITGRKVFEKSKKKVARIDALDPAGPNFDTSPSPYQLGAEDAEFVQAIHCNMGALGSAQNRGTVDFYPNGGNNLPGCEGETKPVSKDICNHVRCNDLYIEMVTEEQSGCVCESWEKFNEGKCNCEASEQARIGYHCKTTAKGEVYMNVTLKSEYNKYPANWNKDDYADTSTPKPDDGDDD